jgi:L-ascorbate metabolism protein UlaG (beta-lactamase superfamily)
VSLSSNNSLDRREKKLAASRRFRDGRFWNTHAVRMMREPPGVGMMLDFVAGSGRRVPQRPLPLFASTAAALSSSAASGLRVTWLGHSTVLVEIDGVRLLTDPVFGERASPLSFAGPRRFHRPPLALGELGRIDAVVLSHDHYDHLCAKTVRALAAGIPGFSGRFVTTLGVGAHLERLGVRPDLVHELDWGEGFRVEGAVGATVDVVATPSQHFSGRGALDRNQTLWAGMAMIGPRHRVFFSGDTGPTPEHKDIGASLGPFDVAMFEIGAFHPAWGDIHLGPLAAWDAFCALGARQLLPVHWSTFDLGLHPWEEPGELLYRRVVDAAGDGAAREALLTPLIGEPLEGGSARVPEPWWRRVLSPG